MSDFITKTKKIILLAGDFGILYFSLYLTLLTRYGWPVAANNWERHFPVFSMVFILWLVVFFINDFYDLKISYNDRNLINNLIRIFLINAAIAIAVFYFVAPLLTEIKPQKVLVINLVLAGLLIFSWRKIFYNFIKSKKIANRVLIIGRYPLAMILAREIKKRPQLGYQVLNAPEPPADLKKYCLDQKIDILTSARELKKHDWLSLKIFDCLSLGIDVYNLSSFYEQITNKIPVEHIEHAWFLENLSEHSKKVYELTKRAVDFSLAVIGLIFTLPAAPIIAVIIRTESSGPIIFKQIRVGRNGRQFKAMKFRSMRADAEKNGPQWAEKNDPRITKFGSFMRKSRLDEIPQLINILKGEMSFVGPRPERPEFVKILIEKIPFYKERLLVRPGLTGWAQLKGPAYGGSKEESLEKLKYDLYYIKHRSFLLDLSIILKTIKLVLSGKGQ